MLNDHISLLHLPNECLFAIYKLALQPTSVPPESDRTKHEWTVRLRKYEKIAIARRHREWALSLRLICRRMDAILQPLVLTRLTLDMSEVLSGSHDMLEMFDSIASGAAHPISQYTEHIFIGSVYDRTTPSDLGTDCRGEKAQKWEAQSPSELRERLIRAESSPYEASSDASVSDESISNGFEGSASGFEGSVGNVEDHVDDPEELQSKISVSESIQRRLCYAVPNALRRFIALKSFKWNMKAYCFDTLVCAAIMDALSTLDTLTSVSFGFFLERLVLPEIPYFPFTRRLALFIYSRWDSWCSDPPVKHSDLISTHARILTRFPGIESLTIQYDGPYQDNDNHYITIKDVFAQCSPERAPPLKELGLMNIPLRVENYMTPFFASLETISLEATTETRGASDRLPIPGSDGLTNLRTLVVNCAWDSAFTTIPRAGLQHLSLMTMGRVNPDEEHFARGNLDLILPGHKDTLESLMLSPYRYLDGSYRLWAYNASMAAMLAEFIKLRHLAIPIFVEKADSVANSVVKTRELIRSLPRALEAIIFYVQESENNERARDFARDVQELIVTAPMGLNAHHYPFSMLIEGDWAYMLKRTSADELKYVRMSRNEIDDWKATLPERWVSSSWDGLFDWSSTLRGWSGL